MLFNNWICLFYISWDSLFLCFESRATEQRECSENKLLSSILGLDVPCCHRCQLGCPFPKIPDINLELNAQWKTFTVEYNIVQEEVKQQNFSTENYEKNYALEMIRRFGMCKNREKINEFVEKNYSNPANKIKYFLLINQGIIYFNTLKKMKKEQKKQ